MKVCVADPACDSTMFDVVLGLYRGRPCTADSFREGKTPERGQEHLQNM